MVLIVEFKIEILKSAKTDRVIAAGEVVESAPLPMSSRGFTAGATSVKSGDHRAIARPGENDSPSSLA